MSTQAIWLGQGVYVGGIWNLGSERVSKNRRGARASDLHPGKEVMHLCPRSRRPSAVREHAGAGFSRPNLCCWHSRGL